jgi:WD40 repeat protein
MVVRKKSFCLKTPAEVGSDDVFNTFDVAHHFAQIIEFIGQLLKSRYSAVQFSPDRSKLASASDDKKVMVWSARTGAHLHTLGGHLRSVSAAQFSPGFGKLLSASIDGRVII